MGACSEISYAKGTQEIFIFSLVHTSFPPFVSHILHIFRFGLQGDRSHQPKRLCQLSGDGRYGGGKSPHFPLSDYPHTCGYSRFRDCADLRFFLRPALYSGGDMDFRSGSNAFAPCRLILQALPLCKSLFEKNRRHPYMHRSLGRLCDGIFPPRHLPSRRT